jgi:Leucine-rich repeat (LRR) protein
MFDNTFSGAIPSNIGELIKLEILMLHGNEFTSTLPTELGAIKELTDLRIFSNNITGTLPTELGQLTSLKLLSLGGNQLSGTIPSWIGEMISLEQLYLHTNNFTGSLPTEVGNLKGPIALQATNNHLSSTIPTEVGALTQLTDLNIFSNAFTGTLPSELQHLTSLSSLSLSSNQFNGTLPSWIGDLNNLTELYLHTNQFSGSLPTEIGYLASLNVLDVGVNRISSTLPSELGQLSELTTLALNRNNFTGTLPYELVNLQHISIIRISHNKFSGTLPSWMNDLDLSVLLINDNQFTGAFEIDTSDMTDLCVDHNNFNGSLPLEIETDYSCRSFSDYDCLTFFGTEFCMAFACNVSSEKWSLHIDCRDENIVLKCFLTQKPGCLCDITYRNLTTLEYIGTFHSCHTCEDLEAMSFVWKYVDGTEENITCKDSLENFFLDLEALTLSTSIASTAITTPADTIEVTTEVLPRETQIKLEIESNVLRRGITFDSLALTDSRTLALDWLIYNDGMGLQDTDSNLGQRFVLALLAIDFGEVFRSNNLSWLSNKTECNWDWVTCDDQGNVTVLELG